MESHQFASPDGKSIASLQYEGEIRFGPAYYSLSLNGVKLLGRSFGLCALWSDDSKYIALQEWLSTAESQGPQTVLLCLEPHVWRQCRVSTAKDGFIEPLRFEGQKLIYVKEHNDMHGQRRNEFEIEFPSLPRWEAL